MREDRIGLDAEKDVCFVSYISLDTMLATRVLSSFGELCDDHEFGRSSNECEGGGEHEPAPVQGFAEVHTSYEIVELFFYAQVVYEHDKQEHFELEKGTISFEM